MRYHPRGRLRGEQHPSAKLTEADVALYRLIARERQLPFGWIEQAAKRHRMTRGAVTMAISGDTWAWMEDPAPVLARRQRRYAPIITKRWLCPWCRGRKNQPKPRCRNIGHTLDHRALSSPVNAQLARSRARGKPAAGE